MTNWEDLARIAVTAMNKAVLYKGHPVGVALLLRDGLIIPAANIESRGYPILHAEVLAVASALRMGYRGTEYAAIAIACAFTGEYPACASCRQFLWEHTHPDLVVLSVDAVKGVVTTHKLSDLYPFPFPALKKEEIVEEKPEEDIKEETELDTVKVVVDEPEPDENKSSGDVKDSVSEDVPKEEP